MNRFGLALAALATLGSAVHAQAPDESRCRSDSSIYSASAGWYGTATGLNSDVVIITNRFGQVISNKTIGQWKAIGPGGHVYAVQAHSGGQTSIRFALYTWANLAGGTYEIRRNGVVIDRDAIN